MIGARASSGWLGTIWAREKASREREREQRRGVWLGVTGWGWLGTVRKRADSEREKAETENERSENNRGLQGDVRVILENG